MNALTERPVASLLPLLAILTAATYTDLRRQRIPNALSLGGAVCGLILAWALAGMDGLALSAGGLALGLVGFLPFYAKNAMGAGDVKLMAAAGSFLGPAETLDALALTLVCGGVMGLVYLAVRGGLRAFFERSLFLVKHWLWSGARLYLQPRPEEAAAERFPYALAISLGTLAALAAPPLLAPALGR